MLCREFRARNHFCGGAKIVCDVNGFTLMFETVVIPYSFFGLFKELGEEVRNFIVLES